MNKAEFPMLGVVLCEYRDAVQLIDGCLSAAIDITKLTEPERAATLEACRLAALQSLSILDGLLAREGRKRES